MQHNDPASSVSEDQEASSASSLVAVPPRPQLRATPYRNLIFASAGDNGNIHRWLGDERNYDLYVYYYGDRSFSLARQVEYFLPRKGSKFQNLYHAYQNDMATLKNYDYILVADDDIIINPEALNHLFDIHHQENFWITQPSFHREGKVSHEITAHTGLCDIRYTNFVETTIPLFRTEKLFDFLDEYDPCLTSLGTDWFFLEVIGNPDRRRVAVIDAIRCLNPRDNTKAAGREFNKVQSSDVQWAIWERLKSERGLYGEDKGYHLYGWTRPVSWFASMRLYTESFLYFLRRIKRRFA